jgi:hypothetical protein
MKMDVDAKYKLAYFNVNKRVRNLARSGFLSEIKPDPYTVNIHGRKDYMLSTEGLRYLAQYMDYSKNVENVETIRRYIESMKERGIAQIEIEDMLLNEFKDSAVKAIFFKDILKLLTDYYEIESSYVIRVKPPRYPQELKGPRNLLPEVEKATNKKHVTKKHSSRQRLKT